MHKNQFGVVLRYQAWNQETMSSNPALGMKPAGGPWTSHSLLANKAKYFPPKNLAKKIGGASPVMKIQNWPEGTHRHNINTHLWEGLCTCENSLSFQSGATCQPQSKYDSVLHIHHIPGGISCRPSLNFLVSNPVDLGQLNSKTFWSSKSCWSWESAFPSCRVSASSCLETPATDVFFILLRRKCNTKILKTVSKCVSALLRKYGFRCIPFCKYDTLLLVKTMMLKTVLKISC